MKFKCDSFSKKPTDYPFNCFSSSLRSSLSFCLQTSCFFVFDQFFQFFCWNLFPCWKILFLMNRKIGKKLEKFFLLKYFNFLNFVTSFKIDGFLWFLDWKIWTFKGNVPDMPKKWDFFKIFQKNFFGIFGLLEYVTWSWIIGFLKKLLSEKCEISADYFIEKSLKISKYYIKILVKFRKENFFLSKYFFGKFYFFFFNFSSNICSFSVIFL